MLKRKTEDGYYLSKIMKIRDNLSDIPTYNPRIRDVPQLERFRELSQTEVYRIIMSMKVKRCELDPLPAQLFRKFAKELTPIITHVINISIKSETFPLEWKYSVVKPLLKKQGLEQVEKTTDLSVICCLFQKLQKNLY